MGRCCHYDGESGGRCCYDSRTGLFAMYLGCEARVGASADVIYQADAAVRSVAPYLNDAQRQIVLAIGSLESGYGVTGSWLKDDGTPSYNWGALVGSGTAGSITHSDNAPDGTPVVYRFKAFNNMGEAVRSFLSTWTRGDVSGDKDLVHEPTTLPAASRGDAYNVAKTMYAHRYYGGTPTGAGAWHPSMGSDDERRIQTYANAILGAARQVAGVLGEPLAVSVVVPPATVRTPFIVAVALSVLTALGVAWLTGRR